MARAKGAIEMRRLWIGLGALAGLTATMMAALSAHAFSGLDAHGHTMIASAVQMQGWHALALFGTGLWAPQGGRVADAAGCAFTAGLILFCGAVYGVALYGAPFGGVAPIGGTLLMLGWGLLAISAWRAQ